MHPHEIKAIENLARENGMSPGELHYELRGGDAMTAALWLKVLGLFCMFLGVMITIMLLNPSEAAMAWVWTAWAAFYFCASLPIVRWGKSRTLWIIWGVLMTLLAISCVVLQTQLP